MKVLLIRSVAWLIWHISTGGLLSSVVIIITCVAKTGKGTVNFAYLGILECMNFLGVLSLLKAKTICEFYDMKHNIIIWVDNCM